jgi:hypothetical protein
MSQFEFRLWVERGNIWLAGGMLASKKQSSIMANFAKTSDTAAVNFSLGKRLSFWKIRALDGATVDMVWVDKSSDIFALSVRARTGLFSNASPLTKEHAHARQQLP